MLYYNPDKLIKIIKIIKDTCNKTKNGKQKIFLNINKILKIYKNSFLF